MIANNMKKGILIKADSCPNISDLQIFGFIDWPFRFNKIPYSNEHKSITRHTGAIQIKRNLDCGKS